MNTRDAAYLTGHNYAGGVPALAVRMGMTARDLSRRLNPITSDISLHDAVSLMTLSGDHRILFALADELGYSMDQLKEK